jgi:putative NADH-flavin reductase
MAIVNQGGEKEINEADYAYSVLDQLSLGTDLINQYIQYLK